MAVEEKNRILIVDDEHLNLKILATILNKDYFVSVAPNGAQALSVAKQLIPDLILLDLMMPVMDGYEFLDHFKALQLQPSIPVLILTALNQGDQVVGPDSGRGESTGAATDRVQQVGTGPGLASSQQEGMLRTGSLRCELFLSAMR